MSFLAKLRQKLKEALNSAEPAPREEKKIKLSELGEFVHSSIKTARDNDQQRALQISQEIISSFKEIGNISDLLTNKEPYTKGKFPSQIISSGRSSKDFLCRQVDMISTKITSPDKKYESLVKFKKTAFDAIIQLNLDPKKAELFMFCFEKEAGLIRNKLIDIKKNVDLLDGLLNKKSALFKSNKLQIKLNEAIKIEGELKEVSNNLDRFSDKLNVLEENKEKIEQKIGKLSVSRKAEGLTAEISSAQQNKKDLLNKLSNEFTILRKALKKYQHDEPKSTRSRLAKYIDDFAETLLDDSEIKIFSVINELSTAIIENNISLDLKSKEKVLALIKLLTKDYVKNLQKQYTEIVEKLDKLEQQKKDLLAPIKTKRTELEKQLRETYAQVVELAPKIKARTKQKESRNNELSQLKSDVEKIASDLTRRKVILLK